MGICISNGVPQCYPAAGAGPALHAGPGHNTVWSPELGCRRGGGLCPAPHEQEEPNGARGFLAQEH